MIQITTHAQDALLRRAEEFKEASKLETILNTVNVQIQDIENALWQLRTERDIDTAIGSQLDNLGKIIGTERNAAFTEDLYRQVLRAFIRANKSSGTVQDIYDVFRFLITEFYIEQTPPASFIFHVNEPITGILVYVIIGALNFVKAGGVRVYSHYSEGELDDTFTFASTTYLTSTYAAPFSTTCLVTSTEGFPPSGSFFLGYGEDLPTLRHRFSYVSKTSMSFEGCVRVEGSGLSSFPSGALVMAVPDPFTILTNPFNSPFPATMDVQDTSLFASSGAVTLGIGRTDQKVFYYTSKGAGVLNGVTEGEGSGTAFSVQETVTQTHQGFGDESDTSLGGQFSGVIET